MGMDVYGNKATAEVGEYFRNSVWSWHPLAEYLISVAPKICAHCTDWHTNDGDGLNAAQSRALAKILRAKLASGEVAAFTVTHQTTLDLLPDEPCKFCNGTGTRTDTVVAHGCNACLGKGTVRPFDTNYCLTVENVTEFADFLEHCGGFKIH